LAGDVYAALITIARGISTWFLHLPHPINPVLTLATLPVIHKRFTDKVR
jgi:hypothetical protein